MLVTGAGGFVGKYLVERALRRLPGAEVIAGDLHAPSGITEREFPGRFRFMKLDVRDAGACAQLLRFARPTHVIHAAAITAGGENGLLDVNVQGTRNLLDATLAASLAAVPVADSPVERFILLSSSAVYGAPAGNAPCDELHPLDLRGAYARSKRLAEEHLLERAAASRVSLVAARLGPCFGPGELAGPYRPSVSLVARLFAALRADAPVSVGGENYSRDWTHLDEIHDALMALLFSPRLESHLYNVSTGVSVSAFELVRFFEHHGLRIEWTGAAQAAIELRAQDGRKPLVIERLRRDTGFTPAVSWQQRMMQLMRSTPGA